jgi:predicted aconitase
MAETSDFGALGKVIGVEMEKLGRRVIPHITGLQQASLEALKSFCASLATYGGVALFHMEGITPEAGRVTAPETQLLVTQEDIDSAIRSMDTSGGVEADFISLGCPHLSIREIARIAELLEGQKVRREFWITTARPTKTIADRMGYTRIIEESGAKFAADTCCVVAPISGRFHTLVTDSAKACYYASSKNKFNIRLIPFDEVVREALR